MTLAIVSLSTFRPTEMLCIFLIHLYTGFLLKMKVLHPLIMYMKSRVLFLNNLLFNIYVVCWSVLLNSVEINFRFLLHKLLA